MLMDEFAELRASRGDPRAPLDPGEAEQRLLERLDGDGMQTLILHPFLMLQDAWWESVRRVLCAWPTPVCRGAGGAVAVAIAASARAGR